MNLNPSLSQDFMLVIPDEKEVNYFCQRLTLPGMNLPAVASGWQNNMVSTPGDTIMYEPLNLDLIIDEEFNNLYRVMEWMLSHKEKNNPYDRLKDIELHILNRNKNSSVSFTFYGAHPTDISGVSFDSTLTDTEVLVCNLTFSYQHYRMNP